MIVVMHIRNTPPVTMLTLVPLYHAVGYLIWCLLETSLSVSGYENLKGGNTLQFDNNTMQLKNYILQFNDTYSSINNRLSHTLDSANLDVLSQDDLRYGGVNNTIRNWDNNVPSVGESRNTVLHGVRFRRDVPGKSGGYTTKMSLRGDVYCNRESRHICKCFACKTTEGRDALNPLLDSECCEKSIAAEYQSQGMVVSINLGMNVTNIWTLEQDFTRIITQSLLTYCQSSPDHCYLKHDENTMTSFQPENVIILKMVSRKDDNKTFPVQGSNWVDVAFVVTVPADTLNQAAVDYFQVEKINMPLVPLPAKLLQIILTNQTSILSSALGVNVSSAVVLWVDFNSFSPADTISSSSTDKDLPMTGIVFGGIFGFLFLLTCAASIHKAIK